MSSCEDYLIHLTQSTPLESKVEFDFCSKTLLLVDLGIKLK